MISAHISRHVLLTLLVIAVAACGGSNNNDSIDTIEEAQEELRSTNQAPVAVLAVFDRVGAGNPLRPVLIDLDASGSTDPDGFIEHYTFQLFDEETGEVLADPVFTREPFATLMAKRELPNRLRARVTIEDDEVEIDTVEVTFTGPDTTCSTTLFSCSLSSGETECQPTAANTSFDTDDLLTAAQQCDPNITKATPLRIAAWGGGGGRGANFWPGMGGAGGISGLAALGTTLADLDSRFGSPDSGTTYCYGLGRQGWFKGANSGSGGASTVLRTCQNVDQSQTTGLLLIAGGGGGGGGAVSIGAAGGAGGVAFSNTSSNCPPTCGRGSTGQGAGEPGEASGGEGGAGGSAGSGGQGGAGGTFASPGFPGAAGIGGQGGTAEDSGPAAWTQGDPKVTGDTGSGGIADQGGAGGGGYGGGGSGGSIFTAGLSTTQRGGGGGGSFAVQSNITYDTPETADSLPGSLGFFFKP